MLPIVILGFSLFISLGFVNAMPLEDYSDTATRKTINKILEYCITTPNANITNDLVNTGNISQFYSDYTCDKAAHDKSIVEHNNPDTNNSTTVTMLH